MADNFLLIHAPGWSASEVPYSLALVAGIIKTANYSVDVLDLNAVLFKAATDDERAIWENNIAWFDQHFVDDFYARYRSTIRTCLRSAGLGQDRHILIGFSVNTYNRLSSLSLGQLIRASSPGVPIIFGGPDCYPNEFHTDYLTNVVFNPDIIFTGEAEVSLPIFLKEFAQSASIVTKVPGFSYNASGSVVTTGRPSLPSLEADAVAADFSTCNLAEYSNTLWLASSRGCINRCGFCNERPNFIRYRRRNLKIVQNEIDSFLVSYSAAGKSGPICIKFADSIINADIGHLDKLLDLLLVYKDRVEAWSAQAAFRVEVSPELFAKMRDAKCAALFWGFESASQKVLDRMNKGYDLGAARIALKHSCDVGIINNLPLIVGFPGETVEELIETLTFVCGLMKKDCIDFIYASVIEQKRGAPMQVLKEQYGIKDESAFGWSTDDGLNTPEVRCFRAYVLGYVIFVLGAEKGKDEAVKGYDIALRSSVSGAAKLLNLNELPLALEMFALLRRLAASTSSGKGLDRFIDELTEATTRKKRPLRGWGRTPAGLGELVRSVASRAASHLRIVEPEANCLPVERLRTQAPILSVNSLPFVDNAFLLWASLDKNRVRDKVFEFVEAMIAKYYSQFAAAAVLTIRLKSVSDDVLEVFYDNGKGGYSEFDERHSAKIHITGGGVENVCHLFVPKGIIAKLRIDPGCRRQEFKIASVSLRDGLHEYLAVCGKEVLEYFPYRYQLEYDGAADDNGWVSLYASGDDPQMVIDPNKIRQPRPAE
jgi:hypothetical protein